MTSSDRSHEEHHSPVNTLHSSQRSFFPRHCCTPLRHWLLAVVAKHALGGSHSLRPQFAFFSVAACVFLVVSSSSAGAGETLSALRASELVSGRALILVDVRNAEERSAFGAPKGALWVEWKGPEKSDTFGSVLSKMVPDKSAPLAFICSVGYRSSQAARVAEALGYSRVFDVAEGVNGAIIGPGWRAWGLPFE